MPAKVETKVVKEVERVEVIPDDYERNKQKIRTLEREISVKYNNFHYLGIKRTFTYHFYRIRNFEKITS